MAIGCDIVEISRIKRVYNRYGSVFTSKILSEKELSKFNSISNMNNRLSYLAGRFACKEAIVKCLGTGFRGEYSFKNISILNDDNGKPFAQISGNDIELEVSISHSRDYAFAVALC